MKNLGKKAQAENWFAVIVVLFASGFLMVLSYYILSEYNDALSTTSVYTPEMQSTATNFLSGIAFVDYLIVLLMIVLVIGVGITSYKLATKPVFAIVTIIMAALYGFVSYFFNYVFAEMVGQPAFALILVQFPRTIMICTNLHWIMLVMMFIGIVTLFGKKEKGQYLA